MIALAEQIKEIGEVLNRLLDNIAQAICSTTCANSIELRYQIGYVRANYPALIMDGVFGDELLKCFTEMHKANAKLETLARIHQHLFLEEPVSSIAMTLVQSAIGFCLSVEAKLISDIVFESRDDVDNMMAKMKVAFDTAKDKAADDHRSDAYQALTKLAGALTQHLFATSRPLPRIIKFTLGKPFPALKMSQCVYYTGDRWDEIVRENRIVHPLFVPREFRGLSN